MAVVQFVDDLFRGSPYSEKSKNDHANTSSVNDGHFDSVPRFLKRRSPGQASTRLERCDGKSSCKAIDRIRLRQRQPCAAPTVSAILAPRVPSGLFPPDVLSLAVWCSISAFNSPPRSTIVAESQLHTMKAITAPRDP